MVLCLRIQPFPQRIHSSKRSLPPLYWKLVPKPTPNALKSKGEACQFELILETTSGLIFIFQILTDCQLMTAELGDGIEG